jgi:hypothetical protein
MKRAAVILFLGFSVVALGQMATTQPTTEAPGQSTPIIREGSYIVDRTGSLGHSADGQQWQFIFDAATAPPGEPTINILPNLNLMLMENAVASNNQDIHFKIGGMVTEYRGKNYVLLQKVMVVR